MVERRDAGRCHSHQYSPVCDCWFRKIDQLQLFITIEIFCSHCAHISSPFLMYLMTFAKQVLWIIVIIQTYD
jgi:hypothetical protein